MIQITVAQEDRRDVEKLYHKMSLAQLQTLSPFVSSNFSLALISVLVLDIEFYFDRCIFSDSFRYFCLINSNVIHSPQAIRSAMISEF